MFTVTCPRHDAEVLIWPSGVDGIVNLGRSGMLVDFHCTCGWVGCLLTGPGVDERVFEREAFDSMSSPAA